MHLNKTSSTSSIMILFPRGPRSETTRRSERFETLHNVSATSKHNQPVSKNIPRFTTENSQETSDWRGN